MTCSRRIDFTEFPTLLCSDMDHGGGAGGGGMCPATLVPEGSVYVKVTDHQRFYSLAASRLNYVSG